MHSCWIASGIEDDCRTRPSGTTKLGRGSQLMRIGIVGGGLAGALLAWRLAQQSAISEVWLAPGTPAAADATAASGGAVRGYETKPAQRALALASMAELAADPTLRDWSGYCGCGSVYLPAEPTDLTRAAAEINQVLADSASLVDFGQLTDAGWVGLPEDVLGIAERQAGYLDPDRFRRSVLADLAGRGRVTMLPAGAVSELAAGSFSLAGERFGCDLLVLAAGAWTPSLLREAGWDDRRPDHQEHPVHDLSSQRRVADHLRRRPHRPVRQAGAGRSAARPAHHRLGQRHRPECRPIANLPTGPRRWPPARSVLCGCTRPSRRSPRSTAMPNPACSPCVRCPAATIGCSPSPEAAVARPRPRWPRATGPRPNWPRRAGRSQPGLPESNCHRTRIDRSA